MLSETLILLLVLNFYTLISVKEKSILAWSMVFHSDIFAVLVKLPEKNHVYGAYKNINCFLMIPISIQIMSKRKIESKIANKSGKKACMSFKQEWLAILIETDIPSSDKKGTKIK